MRPEMRPEIRRLCPIIRDASTSLRMRHSEGHRLLTPDIGRSMADSLPPPAESVRLLVADDEPHVRRILATLFEAAGYQVELVNDGGSALAALRGSGRYDLVILDIVMPEASGLKVLEEIRASEHRLHTPVIILTAKGQDADREKALSLGADRFLTKPFSPKKLLNQVDELLALR